MEFRHSICNEAFDKWPFADACKAIRKAGYTGIEIAPFTLAETPGEITAAQRARYRDIIGSEGLKFAGLHWLMVSPKGLHVTGPDAGLRRRSWDHIRALIDLCADLGPDGVMVFGSPKQRAIAGGGTRRQATRNYIDGLLAGQAAGGGSLLGRAEHHHAVRSQIGAQIDQRADVVPTAAAQTGIGAGYVQTFGAHHQPVQAGELPA